MTPDIAYSVCPQMSCDYSRAKLELGYRAVDSNRWNGFRLRDRGPQAKLQRGWHTFFHKGTNGRWKDVLSAEEIAKCEKVAARHLTPDCAHWLKTGEIFQNAG